MTELLFQMMKTSEDFEISHCAAEYVPFKRNLKRKAQWETKVIEKQQRIKEAGIP